MVRARPTLLAAALLGLAALEARAVDVVVGTGQPASCTESALDAAVNSVRTAGGTITFNCGGPATIPISTEKHFYYNVNPNLTYTIDGGGLITLNAQGVTRHIRHFSGTLNIRNMTFTGGRAAVLNYGTPYEEPSGGAIRSDRAFGTLVLNLTNVVFTGNSTNLSVAPNPPFSPFDYGGAAVFTRLGTLTVSNCTFTGNTANNTAGGAIHGRSSTINITGSTFTSNSSSGGGFGGAITVDGVSPAGASGSLQVSTSSFTGNTTRNQGGAIFFYLYPEKNESAVFNTVSVTENRVVDSSGTFLGTWAVGGGISGDRGNVSISNSTVANNVAHSNTNGGAGGGIALSSNGTIVISNSTISGNRAEGSNANAAGGGVLIFGNSQPFLIRHSTIANNVAGWTGGGIQSLSTGTLTNTIVANNIANAFSFGQQCLSRLTNGGGALQFPGFNAADPNDPGCANGVTVADPRLASLNANGGFGQTHLLGTGSPAVDAGACVLATDQRGVTRPQGGACDLGAVEMRPGAEWLIPVPPPVPGTRMPDFNADGRADLPWRNQSTGSVFHWLLNGASVISQGTVGVMPYPSWTLNALEDFDGDGRTDELWRNTVTGEVFLWRINGTSPMEQGSVGVVSDLKWRIVGVGDFDGDQRADILWRHDTSGRVVVWFLNGSTKVGSGLVGVLADAAWQVAAVGDFSGDARTDILWRHRTSGQVFLWMMNGTVVESQGAVETVSDPNWVIVGARDYDANGQADILWRHQTSGKVVVWLMDGTAVIGRGLVATLGDLGWRIVGSGDYDGDAHADILWRHQTTGQVFLWLLNGLHVASQAPVGTVADMAWQTIGP
jgi:hypothetical protein